MSNRAERAWVTLKNSKPARRVLKSGPVRRLRGSAALTWLERRRLRRRARVTRESDPTRFDEVHTLCLLIGHTKSGGSLLGAMLDAHPVVAFGDEVDVVSLVRQGFTAEEMFDILAHSSRREAMKGRVTARRLDGGYSLAIPGSAQGRIGHPRVMGVSRAGPTTRLLGESPASVSALEERLSPRRVAFVQVVRTPADSVAAMILRSGRDPVAAVLDHRNQCERLEVLRDRLGDRLMTIYYEDLVGRTVATVRAVLDFLGVVAEQKHLEACSELVDPELRPESDRVQWPTEAQSLMAETVATYGFLDRYVTA